MTIIGLLGMHSAVSIRSHISPDLSRQFAAMSFVSAVLIVALHTLSATNIDGVLKYAYQFIKYSLCLTAIPWFFFAAGFFLAGHIGEDGWWKRAVLKRVKTLLVPFWIWSAIFFFFSVGLSIAIHWIGYPFAGPDALEWLNFRGAIRVVGLDWYDTMPTMWFLRTLFVFVVLSPCIASLRLSGILLLFLLLCLFVLYQDQMPDYCRQLGINLLSIRGLVCFAVGIYMRINWHRRFGVPIWLVWLLSLVLSSVHIYMLNSLSDSEIGAMVMRLVRLLQLPPLICALFGGCGCIKLPRNLLGYSFPLYLTHLMVSCGVLGVFLSFGGKNESSFVRGNICFCATLPLSLLISYCIKKFFPRFSIVAFGGR